jgi:hypothetical protein
MVRLLSLSTICALSVSKLICWLMLDLRSYAAQEARVGAAVFVVGPLNTSGSLGQLSRTSGMRVVVVVGVGAAVVVLEAVAVFGLVGAEVVGVEDGVAVVVGVGAAVGVLKLSRSSGSSGHWSTLSGMPSPSRSLHVAVGAAVVVLHAVAVFGHERALVVDVEDAVAVVVGLGAAVLVFEVVEVFGLERAAVYVVAVAVAVGVADAGLEDEADEAPHPRRRRGPA